MLIICIKKLNYLFIYLPWTGVAFDGQRSADHFHALGNGLDVGVQGALPAHGLMNRGGGLLPEAVQDIVRTSGYRVNDMNHIRIPYR